MTPRRQRRLWLLAVIGGGILITTALTLNAFQQNLLFFLTPTQAARGEAAAQQVFRLGGMVAENSVVRGDDLRVRFDVTDFARSVTVEYDGVLPDLFREGQGVVVRGMLRDGVFIADEVLAKHDENYMPPEVKNALDAAKTLQPQ